MDELETSLIVSGRGSHIKAIFTDTVSVQGKSIGVKSVSFPNRESQSRFPRYKVRVRDSGGKVHTLSLPPYEWYWSEDLMRAIFGVLIDFYDGLDQQTYIIDKESSNIRDPRKPWYNSKVLSRGKQQASTINYGDSGLKILRSSPDRFWSPEDDVFHLLKDTNLLEDNDIMLSYRIHFFESPEPTPITETLQPVTEPVFLFCDAVKPSYVGGVKKRVLDLVDMTYDAHNAAFFSNTCIQFHKFAVDAITQINFYFQTNDGVQLNFDDPVVIHLLILKNLLKHYVVASRNSVDITIHAMSNITW